MAGKVNIRADEFNMIADQIKKLHEEDKAAIQKAIRELRELYEGTEGFFADQTSAAMLGILNTLEHEVLPQYIQLLEDTEKKVDEEITKLQEMDIAIM